MKICHITYSFPPVGAGGSQTHNYSLVKYLIQRGYEVDVIVVRPSFASRKQVTGAADAVNKGIKVHNIWYNGFPFWVFKVRKKIKEIEKSGKIDTFDIHSTNDVLNLLFQKRTIIFSLHFFELNCPGPLPDHCPRPCLASFNKCRRCSGARRYFQWKLIRWYAAKKVTKFMVKYEYMKHMAVESGIREDKIEVVPFWLDIEKFRKIVKNPNLRITGVNQGDKLCVHVGRLSSENGVMELLEAFKILTNKTIQAKLVFVGDGNLKKDMQDFCHKNQIEHKVIFVGAVDREDVFRYLSLADCVVSCQLYHNYNWSLLEYMCAQKPIVATNVGGTTEILEDGYNALLAEPTAESLALKIQQILENPELGTQLARSALATVTEKHGLSNLEKYENLVRRFL